MYLLHRVFHNASECFKYKPVNMSFHGCAPFSCSYPQTQHYVPSPCMYSFKQLSLQYIGTSTYIAAIMNICANKNYCM